MSPSRGLGPGQALEVLYTVGARDVHQARVLRSWILEGGEEVLYQEGDLASLLSGQDLMTAAEAPLIDGSIMFCGTFEVRGGIRPSDQFRYELEDAVRSRSIKASCSTRRLPLIR